MIKNNEFPTENYAFNKCMWEWDNYA